MNAPTPTPETLKKTGKIMLVGLGPGSNDHLTARARAAIAEADTIIGYVTYIRLVADLVVGKEVIKEVDDRGTGSRHRIIGARQPGQKSSADFLGRCRNLRHGRANF